MTMPAVGSILKVIGSSMANVVKTFMPGSTPTTVPSSAPIQQNSRFVGVSATLNPCRILARTSTAQPPHSPPPEERQLQFEQDDKNEGRESGQRHVDGDHLQWMGNQPPEAGDADQRGRGD